MKRISLYVAMAAGCLIIGGAAVAQSVTTPTPNIIKAGIFWPSKTEVRDATSSTWWNVGYERTVANMPASRSAVTAEVGYMHGTGTEAGTRTRAYMIPVLVNWKQSLGTGASRSTNLYYGVGAGVYFQSAKRTGVITDSTSQTRIGIAPLVGIEGRQWIFELKYHFIPKILGISQNGLSVDVGWKF